MLTVCAALCIGYIIHRVTKPKNVLKIQDIFDWIDVEMSDIDKNKSSKLEVNVLPNSDSQKLTKQNDKHIYVAVIKDGDKVLKTKTFYATSVDIDLESLNKGEIVVIPIK